MGKTRHATLGAKGSAALLGMAGVMGSAMRAPLTGAIFAVELTGHFAALPATAATACAGYAVAVLVLKRSILTEKISRRGRHIMQEYGIDPLALAQAGQIMTRDPQTLSATMTVRDAIAFFESAKHRSYPVVDAANRPMAIASRSDALRWSHSEVDNDVTLADRLSDGSLPVVDPTMPANDIATLMINENIGRVCVVDGAGTLVGLVARRNLLQARAGQVRQERDRTRS